MVIDSKQDLPQYTKDSGSESDSDSSNNFIVGSPSIPSSKSATVVLNSEEYEDDEGDDLNGLDAELIDNITYEGDEDETMFVGLKEKQKLHLSGVFRLQVVKGGIVYNNVHYNASREILTFWHPLSQSIPTIDFSHFAGWQDTIFLPRNNRFKIKDEEFKSFPCVLRIFNSDHTGLLEAGHLYRDVNYLWKPKEPYFPLNERTTYHLLHESDRIQSLSVPGYWSTPLEKLYLSHKNAAYDTRIMVIGGKNSGKSTFLRLLLEKFTQDIRDSTTSQEELVYLDLDPGQPEYSLPDSISLNKILSSPISLGQHLCQGSNFQTLLQFYAGSSSPQDEPTSYLNCADKLIDHLEEQAFFGTSLLNLPGWIKGFGMQILNHIIRKYKPTHLLFLETANSKRHLDELTIPQSFSTSLRDAYAPEVVRVPAHSLNHTLSSRFHASQLRTFKILALFHKITQFDYDFAPLLKSAPLQISYGKGKSGIKGIQFPMEFQNLNPQDIKSALEGTVIGIYTYSGEDSLEVKSLNTFPILQSCTSSSKNFITLGLIHSIDTSQQIMNIYVPPCHTQILDKQPEDAQWIIVRNKTETPFCDFLPSPRTITWDDNIQIPFATFERRKKLEHVWKVRKNVMRRGQFMKR
ncbi:BBF_HP2_G0034920.mRNA.1.CDS.1 [Saccharomyces cerevisiae]|nr:BBF_HP2_G0034920.mRNA.1.CDS.1 [Saccharomyces cerevisiae]CAI6642526.1 BBF_HP2_G0034920.mRNA.1.CDS.1 [Saccharomyces cerevisiae]CAI6646655.1 BBF_HP1_G0035330.mRNA.1.CDS.1 [Saccharomyces cerevisiae]